MIFASDRPELLAKLAAKALRVLITPTVTSPSEDRGPGAADCSLASGVTVDGRR